MLLRFGLLCLFGLLTNSLNGLLVCFIVYCDSYVGLFSVIATCLWVCLVACCCGFWLISCFDG